MHILMVSLDFIPTVGGITAHVYELSKSLILEGHSVSLITREVKETKSFEVVDGISVYRIDIGKIGFFYGYYINKYIEKIIKKINPDIIHIHGLRPLEFYTLKSIPLVYTNHTSGYLKRIKKGGYRVYKLKKLFQKPKLFLAPSKELLQTPFEIQAIKEYIPNGVVAEKFAKDKDKRDKTRAKFGYRDDDIVAIVTRRMVWKNGVIYLAKATKYIKNPHLKLLFIGDGEEFVKVKEILEQNFKDRYIMLGSKTHKEIVDLYSCADISILPSLMEATSISGLEAMAASLPLVGTRVGGIPDIIQDGINGFLCNPKDEIDLSKKIDKLLKCDYKQMGNNSLKIVKSKFDWQQIAKKTINAYKKVKKANYD